MRLVLLAAASLLAGGCHSFYRVQGTVTSCATSAPIAGAHLDLSYPGEHGVNETEADGTFVVAVNDPPNDRVGRLVITAPGYRTVMQLVRDGERVEICLPPE
jgi:hypothetical protein